MWKFTNYADNSIYITVLYKKIYIKQAINFTEQRIYFISFSHSMLFASIIV